jgi:GAF domain-containing protein
MDEKTTRRSQYVGRTMEDTQRLLKELLGENEKLKTLAAAVERENDRLQQQLTLTTEELERHHREYEALRSQLATIESESRHYSEQFAEVEQRNANLANLYVASYQLHGTLDREAVLNTIREIVINLVGCEELAVFEMTDDGLALNLVTSFGVDETRFARLSVVEHPIGRLALNGETYIHGQSEAPADRVNLVACVPLKLDGRVTGAIALFSLLGHKPGLQEADFELFDLLGTHAATALYCTSLYQRVRAGAAA